MKGKKKDNCPFCEKGRKVLAENSSAYAIKDAYPVSEGHTLVISKRHIADFYELTEEEQADCWILVKEIKNKLLKLHKPDGFNVGMNIGEAAGQTVFHSHIHIIPRYEGDMADPSGGLRHALKGKGYY